MSEKILNVDYESEMGQSYVDYSMSVITERALPDVRDGLKPVQRRILYSLNGLAGSDKPHRKCARIVGVRWVNITHMETVQSMKVL